MKIRIPQNNFERGEISPAMTMRTDLNTYVQGAEEVDDFKPFFGKYYEEKIFAAADKRSQQEYILDDQEIEEIKSIRPVPPLKQKVRTVNELISAGVHRIGAWHDGWLRVDAVLGRLPTSRGQNRRVYPCRCDGTGVIWISRGAPCCKFGKR